MSRSKSKAIVPINGRSLVKVDKPIIPYNGEVLIMPSCTQTSEFDKDKALTSFAHACFMLAGIGLVLGYIASAMSPF